MKRLGGGRAGEEACLPLVPVYARPAGRLAPCSRLGGAAWLGTVFAAPVRVILLRSQSSCVLFYLCSPESQVVVVLLFLLLSPSS